MTSMPTRTTQEAEVAGFNSPRSWKSGRTASAKVYDAGAFEPVADPGIDRVAEPDLPLVEPDREPIPPEPFGQVADDGLVLRGVAEEDVVVERPGLVLVHRVAAPRTRHTGESHARPMCRGTNKLTPPRGQAP